MSIEELQQIRDGLCEKAERLMAPGAPLDPAIIANNGQGHVCGLCGRSHLHITPVVLKFWAYQDVNLACWELQKELRAKELQLAVAIEQVEELYGGFAAIVDRARMAEPVGVR